MNKNEKIISSAVYIAFGLLLIILKNDVISIALTILGVALIIYSIYDFVHKRVNEGVIKAVMGVCVLVFGWVFVTLALYMLAAYLLITGTLRVLNLHKFISPNLSFGRKVLLYVRPAVTVIAGICMLFNQGGTISWIFVVTGVLLIIEGILTLAEGSVD